MSKAQKLSAENIKKIKFIITDIDGVWTDGGLYYTTEGLVMKRFQVKDGMGVHRIREHGIEVGIISGDNTDIIKIRGQRLNIDYVYYNIQDKKQVLDEICSLRNIQHENVAFIGDDVNDLDLIAAVGLSAAPSDAVEEVLDKVDYICRKGGGEGAFREFMEFIIKKLDSEAHSPIGY